jgi:hypothetical protein
MFSAVGYCFSVTVASGFLFLFFVSFVCLGACGVVFLCASLFVSCFSPLGMPYTLVSVLIKVCYFKKNKLYSAKE